MQRTIDVTAQLNDDASWTFSATVNDFATDGTLVTTHTATSSIGSTSGMGDGQAFINGASLALGQIEGAGL
jgi:hypothetical protein